MTLLVGEAGAGKGMDLLDVLSTYNSSDCAGGFLLLPDNILTSLEVLTMLVLVERSSRKDPWSSEPSEIVAAVI